MKGTLFLLKRVFSSSLCPIDLSQYSRTCSTVLFVLQKSHATGPFAKNFGAFTRSRLRLSNCLLSEILVSKSEGIMLRMKCTLFELLPCHWLFAFSFWRFSIRFVSSVFPRPMLISISCLLRAALARWSAISFPFKPTWLGIHKMSNLMLCSVFSRLVCLLMFCTRSGRLIFLLFDSIASIALKESVHITIGFDFKPGSLLALLFMLCKAMSMAFSSAVAIAVLFVILSDALILS